MNISWRDEYQKYKNLFRQLGIQYQKKPELSIYTEIILSLLTILILSAFAIKPTVLTIIELNKELKSKEKTVIELNQKVKNLQRASSIIEKNEKGVSLIYQAVPDTPEIEILFANIIESASKYQVKISSLTSSDSVIIGKIDTKKTKIEEDEKMPEGSDQVQITFSVSGTFPNIYEFIKEIENLKRPLKVDLYTLSSSISEGKNELVLLISGRFPYKETE